MMASADHDPRKAGTIWMIDLDEPIPTVIPGLRTSFRRLGPESIRPLAAAMHGVEPGEIHQRFENGKRCYSAWVEGKLAAYGWASFQEEMIGELRLRLRLVKGEVYIWDCFTLPGFRQQHLYAGLLAFMLDALRTETLCRVWIGADSDNLASQAGIARAGFHHVANLTINRVLALRLMWVQGLPGVPETIVDEARRAFLNNRDNVWKAALADQSVRINNSF